MGRGTGDRRAALQAQCRGAVGPCACRRQHGPMRLKKTARRSRSLGPVPEYLLVSTTAPSRESAAELLRSAVGERLAASGQVFGPALSAFWHQGEFGEAEEWQIFLKTEASLYQELAAHLIEKHPWQNPEITAIKIAEGSDSYLEWISRTTRRE